MKILALESSSRTASVCLCEDTLLIGQSYQNSGLTHSRTLLPMAEYLLKNLELSLDTVDVIAVAAGPGSFTGLRIGVSTAKGLAWALEKPCAKVSTLEAMAWNLASCTGEICCVMDARRNEFYNARFSSDGEKITRLTPDRAIAWESLAAELQQNQNMKILVGDGAQLCYNQGRKQGIPLRIASPNLCFPSAWGVARAAWDQAQAGQLITAEELVPEYHRLSQAERERLARGVR